MFGYGFVLWVLFVVLVGLLLKKKSPANNKNTYNYLEVEEKWDTAIRFTGVPNSDPKSPFCVSYEKNKPKKVHLS
jgi:hypothetical protein